MQKLTPRMRAISLWRPWPWAIAGAPRDPKRLENRGYRPRCLLGRRVALHAGQRWDADAAALLGARYPDAFVADRSAHPTGIVGVARVVGWLDFEHPWDPKAVGAVELVEHVDSPWLIGPIAWVLDDVQALPVAVPCPGRQGIWTLPLEVEAAVRSGLARDTRGGQESGPGDRGCSKRPGQIGRAAP